MAMIARIVLLLSFVSSAMAAEMMQHSAKAVLHAKHQRRSLVGVCENDCSGHGLCQDGAECACEPGFEGNDCSKDMCEDKDGCNGNGACRGGLCVCYPGFEGDDCDKVAECPLSCNGHGDCKNGACFCHPGYDGETCLEITVCKDNCNNKGLCSYGECMCLGGWAGKACDKPAPTKDCSSDCGGDKRGECRGGSCVCYPGYDGEDCRDKRKCEDMTCSGHGVCGIHMDSTCVCQPGWSGDDCSKQSCPHGEGKDDESCHGNGICSLGLCFCDPGFEGEACETESKCLNDCSGAFGVCHYGKCMCHAGYMGEDCSQPTHELRQLVLEAHCPNDCSSHGVCTFGMLDREGNSLGHCECLEGWEGDDCSKNAACDDLHNCNGHGTCVDTGICVCDCGYNGASCADVAVSLDATCTDDCSGHGECLMGECFCEPGFSGESCSIEHPCPHDCNGRGQCKWGKCFCDPGFVGIACQEETGCNGCGGHGLCCNGGCYCEYGFIGDMCSISAWDSISCPNDCSGHGACDIVLADAVCVCEEGFAGRDCSDAVIEAPIPDAPSDSFRSSAARVSLRQDDVAAIAAAVPRFAESEVKLLTPAEAKLPVSVDMCLTETCGGNGVCRNNRCFCYPGWSGELCAAEAECASDCHGGNGICKFGLCFCNLGFAGVDCGDIIEVPTSPTPASTCSETTCNSVYGHCGDRGVCVCHEGISHPACASAKELETPCVPTASSLLMFDCASCNESQSSATNEVHASLASADSYALNASMASVSAVIGVAFVVGLLGGLVIQLVSTMRQRAIARSILASPETEEVDEDYLARVSSPLLPAPTRTLEH